MSLDRFYVDNPLIDHVTIEGGEHHHIAHVMRMHSGDILELVNGKGVIANAKILHLTKKEVFCKILTRYEESSPIHRLILAQALPKTPRLDYILEKGTELGVTDIWLFPGEKSDHKSFSSLKERSHHILICALKQCKRAFLPELVWKPSLLSWEPSLLPKCAYFGDLRSHAPWFLDALSSTVSTILIAIGPESGFTQKEVSHMEQALHMQGVLLHHNVLRTDTATITALSLASHYHLCHNSQCK